MKVYQFDTEIAQIYGVDCAIMIWNFQYWIEHNKANGLNFYDGRYWTFNSVDAFTKLFPFWSKGQIRRILKSLEEQGVIMTGNYNSSAYLRTIWYAFTDSFLQMHLLKSTNGYTENENSISNNASNTDRSKQIINTDNKAADGDLFPSEDKFPIVVTRPRKTSETLCLFADSRYFDFGAFEREFNSPEFNGVDIVYYYNAVADWSAQKGKKMRDWIATTRNFIRRDMENNKVHKIGGTQIDMPEDAKEYLESMSLGL